MDEKKSNNDTGAPADDAMRIVCPQCSSTTRIVTAVTVKTLGLHPRTVLVTYRCESPVCQFKFPLSKPETELTDTERALWR